MPESNVLLLNPLGIFGAGIVTSWFWIRTESIWLVSLAHGALNNWGQYAFKYMQDNPKNFSGSMWLLVGLNGSLFILRMVILTAMKTVHGKKLPN